MKGAPSAERMQAIVVERAGSPEVMVPSELEKPSPGPGEVLVRLYASGVNYADLMLRSGKYPGMRQPPRIPGCEGSGYVESVGRGANRFRRGDRVGVYSPGGGAYAEWMTARETHVLPLPPAMSFVEGAAFLHVFLTAYHALRTLGRARPDEWLIVTAAAGGVGSALVQLALAWGIRIIGAV